VRGIERTLPKASEYCHDGRVKPLHIVLCGALVTSATAGLAAGCGSGGSSAGGRDAGTLIGPADSSILMFGDDTDSGVDGSTFRQGTLVITPTAPTVAVTTGQPAPSVQFSATVGGTATSVAWGIDRGELGTIDGNGVFRPSGTIGGTGNVTAAYGGQKVTTTITVTIKTTQQGDPAWTAGPLDAGAGGYRGVGGDGPGGAPSTTQMTALAGTPTADATVSLVYPYDGTVWPQGLLAPLLQWNAGARAFDSVYVHLTEKNYEYQGYFAANKTPFANLPIPEAAWDAATLSNGGEPLVVSLVFAQGASVFGPYTESWTVAQATLQGTIYYNSYGTALVKNSNNVDGNNNNNKDHYGNQYGAGTLAIAPGALSPVLAAGIDSPGDGSGCRVCHTVSADGTSLVTQASNANASDYSTTVQVNLANDVDGGGVPVGKNLAFPALYRDGSLLLSSGGGMINGGNGSHLYSLPSGAQVTTTGLPSGFQAGLPAFSPDGKHVSFNFWGGTLMAGATTLTGDKTSLALLDFDGTSTFSNPRVVYTPSTATPVTYSSFLPSGAGVVFEIELSNPANQWGFTWNKNTGELWWVDVASGSAHRLDRLNGYGASGVYLPDNQTGAKTHTATQDATLNYEPTVNPIASGGYAWVVFTSRRMYGNVAQLDPWLSDPRSYPWLDEVTDKKLWVAAVDLNAPAGSDPSHPAFYLPAQELHAGNSRGYWSVEACKADGMSCQTGDQCCGGYCQPGEAGLTCSSSMPSCSAMYDKCKSDSDCCGAQQGITCINSVCTVSQPPAK
jgi:hypothetical protein